MPTFAYVELLDVQEQFDTVSQASGIESSACSCVKCKKMCIDTPCMGTPADIALLKKAGYSERLSPTLWAAGIFYGVDAVELTMPKFDEQRMCCTFFTDDGLCELHEKGLKPTEGKLAHCSLSVASISTHPAFIIAEMWRKIQ